MVEPLTGFSFFYEFSHLDRTCFQQFLELLSLHLGDDIAVMQVDQASAHTANALVCPSNIILTFQPPHAPELNPYAFGGAKPYERLWLFLKKQFAWVNCPTLKELRQLLASELDKLSPDLIASLTSYDFILEALFGAASY